MNTFGHYMILPEGVFCFMKKENYDFCYIAKYCNNVIMELVKKYSTKFILWEE